MSATCFLFVGSLNLHSWAAVLHFVMSWSTEVDSCLKTFAFLVFQSCQQPNAMKAENSSVGIPPFVDMVCRDWVVSCSICGSWSLCQNIVAMWQPLIMCSGVSSCSLHTSHVLSTSILFLCSTDRAWILPWSRSHMKSCTLGGAWLPQTKLALGSSGYPLAFSSL